METEKWMFIDGFDNTYQVSNLGRVKNKKGVILNPRKTNTGYLSVRFYIKGFKKPFSIHRLVCMSFLLNTENKPYVNHKNGIKTDNRLTNLEWCTPLENVRHAIKNKLWVAEEHFAGKGEKNGFHKLKDFEVLEIRSKFKPRVYTREMLAKEYNVSAHCIKDIVIRKSWKHI